MEAGQLRETAKTAEISDDVWNAIRSADVVINAAGSPDATGSSELELNAANALVPAVLATATKAAGKRFVHISSAAVQGNLEPLDSSERYQGFSAYSRSKIRGEQAVRSIYPDNSVIYRPPGVHAPSRKVTQSIAKLAQSPLSIAATGPERPTPQALLENVSKAAVLLATSEVKPPLIVHHPWEGITASQLLKLLGGKEPRKLPASVLRIATMGASVLGGLSSRVAAQARRAELLLFGQKQAPSWLTEAGLEVDSTGQQWIDLGVKIKEDSSGGATDHSALPKKKALLVATVLQKHILVFHLPAIKLLHDKGYEVHVCATNDTGTDVPVIPYCDEYFDVEFSRKPWSVKNIGAYKELKRVIDSGGYDLIHCHTPTGGALTRLAARNARKKTGTRVIYTAHGFHFYTGAPVLNWLVFLPVEWILAGMTDVLLTINSEDYNRARKLHFPAQAIRQINGVGIDLSRFSRPPTQRKAELRASEGLAPDDFVLFYAAELSPRKSQEMLMRAVSIIREEVPTVRLLLAGDGELREDYERLIADLDIGSNVKLLGFRNNIQDLLAMADVAVSSSKQEGLPVNLLEAVAVGLPLVVTDCRGNRDVARLSANSKVVPLDDWEAMASQVVSLAKVLGKGVVGEEQTNLGRYSAEAVLKELEDIYVGGQ